MTTPIYTRTQNFLSKAKSIHKDKYDYSLVNYTNNKTKVKIICPIHGCFDQIPHHHINGNNCPKCSIQTRKLKRSTPPDIFIQQSNIKHNNKFDYSLIEYINNRTKIKIICPIHGIFDQTPNDHLHGGCLKCSDESRIGVFNNKTLKRDPELANTPSILYMIEHKQLTKIGITTTSVKSRFNKSIKIISQLKNIPLIGAFNKEQEILSKYSNYQERPTNWCYQGNTEFLNISHEQRNQIIISYFIEQHIL